MDVGVMLIVEVVLEEKLAEHLMGSVFLLAPQKTAYN